MVAGMQMGEEWELVHGCKSRGALNLDAACSGVATLEHFVIFSSLVATAGNEGKPALAAAHACPSLPPLT